MVGFVLTNCGTSEQAAQPAKEEKYPYLISFASNMNGNYNIYTMEVDGSDVQQVTFGDNDNTSPLWLDSIQTLAFLSHSENKDSYISIGRQPFRHEIPSHWELTIISQDGEWLFGMDTTLNWYKSDDWGKTADTLENSYLVPEIEMQSPDGTYLLIIEGEYGQNLKIKEVKSGSLKDLASQSYLEGSPTWIPRDWH